MEATMAAKKELSNLERGAWLDGLRAKLREQLTYIREFYASTLTWGDLSREYAKVCRTHGIVLDDVIQELGIVRVYLPNGGSLVMLADRWNGLSPDEQLAEINQFQKVKAKKKVNSVSPETD
jgi:hypothetical protein